MATINSDTGLEGRLLGLLCEGGVCSRDELAEALAEEVETGLPDFSASVGEALEGLVKGGLAHRIPRSDLLAVSRRGLRARQGVDPSGAGLRVPDGEAVGALTPVGDPDASDRLVGGAEGLTGQLDTLGVR